MPESAFQNFSCLAAIDLSSNPLTIDSMDLDRLFAPLICLRSLKLDRLAKSNRHNMFIRLTSAICRNLQGIAELSIDVVDGFHLSEDCRKLTNLKNLTFYISEALQLQNQSLKVLEDLPIEEFHLIGGHIYKPLAADFLWSLTHMRTLSVQAITGTTVSDLLETILYPLQNNKDPINLIFKQLRSRAIQKLSSKQLTLLKNICVKRLILKETFIQSIAYTVLHPSRLWSCLEELDISENYLLETYDAIIYIPSVPNIRAFNICCQRIREGSIPYTFNRNFNNKEHKKDYNIQEIQIYFPNTLTSISFSDNDLQSNFYDVDLVIHAKGVKNLFLRNMFLKNCLGTWKGFQNLETLQITRWNCVQINPYFIANLTSVRELTFALSNLGENAKTMTFFTQWVNLEFIDISQNYITDLHPHFFKYQRELEKHYTFGKPSSFHSKHCNGSEGTRTDRFTTESSFRVENGRNDIFRPEQSNTDIFGGQCSPLYLRVSCIYAVVEEKRI